MLEQKQVKGNERLMVVTSVFIGSLVVRNMEKQKFSSLTKYFLNIQFPLRCSFSL